MSTRSLAKKANTLRAENFFRRGLFLAEKHGLKKTTLPHRTVLGAP
jgi:hypothetical protein